MKLKSKSLQIGQCDMQNAEQRTTGKKKTEYHVVVPIRRLRRDKNCPAEKSWPNYVKNKQDIGSKKTRATPKMLNSLNIMMQRTANENANGFRNPRASQDPKMFR